MKNMQWLSGAANVVLALCAVVVTALVIRREFFPPVPITSERIAPKHVQNWQSYAAHGNRMGQGRGAVDVVLFSDFQCPACRALAQDLRALRLENPGRIAIVYRHAPLKIHPFAISAARASECAAHQGRFEAYHDALFAKQDSIGILPWRRFAETAGVPDLQGFQRCTEDTAAVAALDRDTTAARALGIHATPAYMINGVLRVGTAPLDSLRAYARQTHAARGRLTTNAR